MLPQPETWEPKQSPEAEISLQEASRAGLFSGKRFLLVGLSSEAEAQTSLLVMENGGKVLSGSTRIVADFAVVPLLGTAVEATVDEVVTDTWVVREIKIFLNLRPSYCVQ